MHSLFYSIYSPLIVVAKVMLFKLLRLDSKRIHDDNLFTASNSNIAPIAILLIFSIESSHAIEI